MILRYQKAVVCLRRPIPLGAGRFMAQPASLPPIQTTAKLAIHNAMEKEGARGCRRPSNPADEEIYGPGTEG